MRPTMAGSLTAVEPSDVDLVTVPFAHGREGA